MYKFLSRNIHLSKSLGQNWCTLASVTSPKTKHCKRSSTFTHEISLLSPAQMFRLVAWVNFNYKEFRSDWKTELHYWTRTCASMLFWLIFRLVASPIHTGKSSIQNTDFVLQLQNQSKYLISYNFLVNYFQHYFSWLFVPIQRAHPVSSGQRRWNSACSLYIGSRA
jgi:hypothetical protein